MKGDKTFLKEVQMGRGGRIPMEMEVSPTLLKKGLLTFQD
jgi:hypothetical protein